MESSSDPGGVPYPEFQSLHSTAGLADSDASPGTAPIRGISLRVTNIEGNPLVPRRGMYATDNSSILDGLASISIPVNLDAAGVDQETLRTKGTGLFDSQGMDSNQPKTSYADKLNAGRPKPKVNFRFLESMGTVDGTDVSIPVESVKKVQDRFTNVLFGYFLGKRLAFPVVEYFVTKRWEKYGLSKCMMNGKGFFFFKFESKEGMEQVLQDGPWLIRNIPIFLKHWSTNTELKKEELQKIPVWVKLHDVPIAAYTEEGLSLIASKVGIPKILDNETANMCSDSWGRSSYARAIIEVDASKDLKETVSIAVPNLEDGGVLKSTINVEYEWTPPRCATCNIFGHTLESCPKSVKPVVAQENKGKTKVDEQGYQVMGRKKSAKQVVRDKPKFVYRPVTKDQHHASTSKPKTNGIRLKNAFSALETPTNDYEENDSDHDEGQALLLWRFLMDSIASWNIRGLNHPLKQKEVRHVIKENNLKVCGILESHVQLDKLASVYSNLSKGWDWLSNGNLCRKGTRIIVGWNPRDVDVMLLSATDQVMHLQLVFKGVKKAMFCSMVYASNDYKDRRELWNSLNRHKGFVNDKPWAIMGDFNAMLELGDTHLGASGISASMLEFKECIRNIEVFDVKSSGLHFTWNQKPKHGVGIMRKIDRVMANCHFTDVFPNAFAVFQPHRVSDHSACVLKLPEIVRNKHKPFKFPNFLIHKAEFANIVKDGWATRVDGVPMFRVVKKLKSLKQPLRSLFRQQGNLHVRVESIRKELDDFQSKVDKDPDNYALRNLAADCQKRFMEASLDEERFLKQKAKQKWLHEGDANTKYFHNMVKSRNHISQIQFIKDANGNEFEGGAVANVLVEHYKAFLGVKGNVTKSPNDMCFPRRINVDKAEIMIRTVSDDEIKTAFFDVGDDKAPGPDGYSAAFFKKSWQIIGEEVIFAIKDFFNSGRLLQEINHTFLALIPKVNSPTFVTDYRPISCCNVIYKAISKILTNRLLEGINDVVSLNQSAFIPGRRISDNIMLTQELLHNYHRNTGPPRCAFKVDVQKAYDTVDWDFLRAILLGFGFHQKMVGWIMSCVTSASYSISINGEIHGYFKGQRGLRQGDPISPYLFTLVMEVLTSILQHAAATSSVFRFHNNCKRQKIMNLCFADDLFLFARADFHSVKIIMDSLNSFRDMSGLVPSLSKSSSFFCNVPARVKTQILSLVPFTEGALPIKYLGVPLIASRLLKSDCKVLVDRISKRLLDWKTKFLSFAGRLQLINSVLAAMYSYWAAVFCLPVSIIKSIERIMKDFLWQHGSTGSKVAKVAWKDVCLPKCEGGLSIRKVSDVNKSLMIFHIYSIVSGRNSLWVEWIQAHRLRGRSFWDVKVPQNSTWGWRKLLSFRSLVRKFFWSQIGNGETTSLWHDTWCNQGPLSRYVSPRNMSQHGLSIYSKVADVVHDGNWIWPDAWRDLFPVLFQLNHVNLVPNKQDVILWRSDEGKLMEFSSKLVWEATRARGQEVNWSKIVWSGCNIPRHSFHCWLIFRRKLWTQDRIQKWNHITRGSMDMMCCLLCQRELESHEHLFFQCSYSAAILDAIKEKSSMKMVPNKWSDIVGWLLPRANSRSLNSVIAKLLVKAAAYFIWQERNLRFFNNQLRPPEAITNTIIDTVRLKLSSFKYKDKPNVRKILEDWKLSSIETFEET
ncbi:putative RNA-directed DNA polymerase [Helianthus annuus]|nr:putative RNA-directed DNA polymerase [Helianthus annuus]